MVTALNAAIGYDAAAAIAKESFKTGKTVRELCLEKKVLPKDELDRLARRAPHDRAIMVFASRPL